MFLCVAVCCSVLHCVAVCCSLDDSIFFDHALLESFFSLMSTYVLQCVAACCSMLQHVAACCSTLQHVAVCCAPRELLLPHVNICVAVRCSALQCVAACCSMLQRVAIISHHSNGVRSFDHALLQLRFCHISSHELYGIRGLCLQHFRYDHRGNLSVLRCVLQRFVVCCSVLQCVAVRYSHFREI